MLKLSIPIQLIKNDHVGIIVVIYPVSVRCNFDTKEEMKTKLQRDDLCQKFDGT